MSSSDGIVLLCGIPSEPPLAAVVDALRSHRTPFLLFNQRNFANADITVEIGPGGIRGELRLNGESSPLEHIVGIYTRLMDFELLPEAAGLAPDEEIYLLGKNLHMILASWIEATPAVVINRTRNMGSNNSKPYQSQIIRKYFLIPDTLITNRSDDVIDFRAQHDAVIFKSISGTRSIVTEFRSEHENILEDLEICPVLFQQKIDGLDIRVHTVGDQVFATSVHSPATDYRYGHHHGPATELAPISIPPEIGAACVQLASDLELPFAGIDLRVTADSEYYCFEVNPSPAFSYFDVDRRRPIANAIASLLYGHSEFRRTIGTRGGL